MATTATPYGLAYHGTGSGGRGCGMPRPYKIASAYGTSIYQGDVVKMASDGTIAKDTGTATLTPLGVFDRVEYFDTTKKEYVFTNKWTASTAASDITAFVYDDPNAVYRIQADETVAQTGVFNNAPVVQGSGSDTTGKSGVVLDGSGVATTNTLPLKIIGFANYAFNEGSTYPDLLVRFNAGMHQYDVATGV